MIENLTNQEIAKVFAMYLGCKVEEDYSGKSPNGTLTEVNLLAGGTCKVLHNVEWAFNIEDCKLVLQNLSSITDEHAIALAKMWQPDYDWEPKDITEDYLFLTCRDYQMWIWFEGELSFEEIYHHSERIAETTTCGNIIELIDQLREWGYALPYKDQSLFELGIAIDKTKLLTPAEK